MTPTCATRYYLRILERDSVRRECATSGSSMHCAPRGRHGEARRRYGFYAAKMEEIAVEAAPYPTAPVEGGGSSGTVVSRS